MRNTHKTTSGRMQGGPRGRRADQSAERYQVDRGYPNETVAHKGKSFELYTPLNSIDVKKVSYISLFDKICVL